jgi:isopentenyl-diphosphate delta-isomerase
MERNKVILVDSNDNAIGEMEKMEAHLKGELHRAFSIFLFNSEGEMLIHQRALHKYHGGGLWSNACCSHPQTGETLEESALERLHYEMGIQCSLERSFSFLYRTPVENGLIEHELDHVFIGSTNQHPNPHRNEVHDFRWISPAALQKEILTHPDIFTYWFRISLQKVLKRSWKHIVPEGLPLCNRNWKI